MTGLPTQFFRIEVTVAADEAEARELIGRMHAALCGDQDHLPPCRVPWSSALVQLSDDDPVAVDLSEQVRIERGI